MDAPRVLQKTTIKTKKRLMYYMGAFNFMYSYTILAYAMAVFLIERFPDNPNAIFFVGVILALANFLGLFVNGIWLYLQKTLSAKTLASVSILGLIISVGIFLGSNIFGSILTLPAFTIVAAFCYIWSFDLYDITMTTLILNKTEPSKQGLEFSQKKIAESVGMLLGIVTGGMLLYFGSVTAQFFLMIFLCVVFIYFKSHFENDEDEVELVFSEKSGVQWKEVLQVISNPDAVQTKVTNASNNLQEKVMHISNAVSSEIEKEVRSIPDTATESLKKASTKTKSILNQARLLLLDILAKEEEIQRKSVPKHDFHVQEIFSEITSSFIVLGKAFSLSSRYAFFWAAIMVMFFSFWDTMAITYQPIFLERFRSDLGIFTVMMMPLFIIPVFILQIPFGKMADKVGNHTMMLIGLLISSLSLILLGTLEMIWGGSLIILIVAGMGNSIGYAAAFSAAQVKLTREIQHYAKTNKKKIENSSMAASLRLTLNIGNIFGQLFGGVIFALLGFLNGFLMLGLFLLFLLLVTLIFFRKLALPKK